MAPTLTRASSDIDLFSDSALSDPFPLYRTLRDMAPAVYMSRHEPVRGPAGYLDIIGMMRSGFPDIQWTLEEMIAENDKVAARFTMRGTHQGAFFGVPPTGKSIAVQAMNIYAFSDGQIVEERGQPDMLELLKQIGAIPAG